MVKALTNQRLHCEVKSLLATHHGRLLALATLAGLIYLPTWLAAQWRSLLSGGSSLMMNAALLWLGFKQLWHNRQGLQQLRASKDDRLGGHLLIVGGAIWLPFIRHSVSMQALVWLLIVIGVAWSSFGLSFFRKYLGTCFLLLLGMYPSMLFVVNVVLFSLMPPVWITGPVAFVSSQALNLIGKTSSAIGNSVILDGQSVLVAPACSGIDMALSLAFLCLILGIMLQFSPRRIGAAMLAGVVIAMVFNIPRVMLMVIAIVYWGQESFDFWHGPWGGQIFATIMFTVAYYAIAPIYDFNKQRKRA
jgi:exosortase